MTGKELAVCTCHYNYTNTNNEVLAENPKNCIYCKCDGVENLQDTVQKAEPEIIESQQQCKNCSGKGRYMGDASSGTYDEIQCEDCDGTGKKQ